MKCPNCGKPIESVAVNRMPALNEQVGATLKCVAYSCESCGVILGVESDPHEHDAQMVNLQEEVLAHGKRIDQLMRKYVGLKEAQKAGGPTSQQTSASQNPGAAPDSKT